jgi:hypothetical protein
MADACPAYLALLNPATRTRRCSILDAHAIGEEIYR